MCGSPARASARGPSGMTCLTPALSQLPRGPPLAAFPRERRRLTRTVCRCKSGFDQGSRNKCEGHNLESESSMIEWFDDLKVGMRVKSEAVTVSKDDIIRFAK